MAKVKLSIENDLGEELLLKSYDLGGDDIRNIDELENVMDTFYEKSMPEITTEILKASQEKFLKKWIQD